VGSNSGYDGASETTGSRRFGRERKDEAGREYLQARLKKNPSSETSFPVIWGRQGGGTLHQLAWRRPAPKSRKKQPRGEKGLEMLGRHTDPTSDRANAYSEAGGKRSGNGK